MWGQWLRTMADNMDIIWETRVVCVFIYSEEKVTHIRCSVLCRCLLKSCYYCENENFYVYLNFGLIIMPPIKTPSYILLIQQLLSPESIYMCICLVHLFFNKLFKFWNNFRFLEKCESSYRQFSASLNLSFRFPSCLVLMHPPCICQTKNLTFSALTKLQTSFGFHEVFH